MRVCNKNSNYKYASVWGQESIALFVGVIFPCSPRVAAG